MYFEEDLWWMEKTFKSMFRSNNKRKWKRKFNKFSDVIKTWCKSNYNYKIFIFHVIYRNTFISWIKMKYPNQNCYMRMFNISLPSSISDQPFLLTTTVVSNQVFMNCLHQLQINELFLEYYSSYLKLL